MFGSRNERVDGGTAPKLKQVQRLLHFGRILAIEVMPCSQELGVDLHGVSGGICESLQVLLGWETGVSLGTVGTRDVVSH